MPLPFLKKKKPERTEFERKVLLREKLRTLKSYISQLESLRKSYLKCAVDAKKLDNQNMVLRYAGMIAFIDREVKYAQLVHLTLQELELGTIHNELLLDFSDTLQKIYMDIFSIECPESQVASIKKFSEEISQKAATLSSIYTEFIDIILTKIILIPKFDQDTISKIIETIETETLREETEKIVQHIERHIAEKEQRVKEPKEERQLTDTSGIIDEGELHEKSPASETTSKIEEELSLLDKKIQYATENLPTTESPDNTTKERSIDADDMRIQELLRKIQKEKSRMR